MSKIIDVTNNCFTATLCRKVDGFHFDQIYQITDVMWDENGEVGFIGFCTRPDELFSEDYFHVFDTYGNETTVKGLLKKRNV